MTVLTTNTNTTSNAAISAAMSADPSALVCPITGRTAPPAARRLR